MVKGGKALKNRCARWLGGAVLTLLWVPVLLAQQPAATAAETADNTDTEVTAPPVEEPALYASREARDMALLAQAMPNDQVVWFDIAGERVLALYQPAISAAPSGAVLLVQDQDRNPTWPERIQALRLALPEQGWTTLVVTLPPAAAQSPPAREPDSRGVESPPTDEDPSGTTQADAEQRPETEEVFDEATGAVASVDDMNRAPAPVAEVPQAPVVPAATRVDQRLAQAIEHLHGKGQFNLALLAEGGGAVRAARLYAAMGGKGFRALVLIDGRHQLAGESGDVLAMLTGEPLPVLDIQVVDEVALLADAQARQATARRAGLTGYQPVHMPPYEPSLARLTKRVRGFLDRHAKGVQVKDAQVLDGRTQGQ